MPYSFTEAYKEAQASNKTSITYIDTLTINHPTFGAPLRFCRSDKNLTLDGDDYVGKQFKAIPPAVKGRSNSGMSVELSDIDRSIGPLLDELATSEIPIDILIKVFLSSQVAAQAEMVAPLEASAVVLRGRTLIISADYPDLINKRIPSDRYTTNVFRGLR